MFGEKSRRKVQWLIDLIYDLTQPPPTVCSCSSIRHTSTRPGVPIKTFFSTINYRANVCTDWYHRRHKLCREFPREVLIFSSAGMPEYPGKG